MVPSRTSTPRVDTYGERKTAHLFGTISLDSARFNYQFADVFNGKTFWRFLKMLIRRYGRQKVFLIIDNGPCHNLPEEGKKWLGLSRKRIGLFRLPPYSPEFNAIEGVWKTTRKLTTHNRFYKTVEERDAALRQTFSRFRQSPGLIAGHVTRFK